MIDMHLHTYYSDGTMSPREIVERAANRGVRTIAITDHDGLNGIDEALKAGKELGVKVIPGVEFSTLMKGRELNCLDLPLDSSIINMHILGYDIDINNKELKKAIEDIRLKRIERNEKLLFALNKIGVDIEEEDIIQRPGQDYIGKPNFALALVNKGYVKNTKEAYVPGSYLKHDTVRQVHREKIHVKRAIDLIRGAGGYSVLAHPLKVKFPNSWGEDKYALLDPLLDELIELGLSGLECYYSTHSKDQSRRLAEMAEAKGLIATSGSDFHGPEFDKNVDIGVVEKI